MALSLSLLSVIILISTGALIFADVSFGILGSMSSTYLIRPASATAEGSGCDPNSAQEMLACTETEGTPGGAVGSPGSSSGSSGCCDSLLF